jgi:glycosyltransferase involved in cell wall biosynthesis
MPHLHHKLSVLHVVTDYKAGGVRFSVEDLVGSRLSQSFDFSVVLLDQAPYAPEVQPDLVVFHSACSWTNIPKLLSLKQLGSVIIQEHHYNEDFDQLTPSPERFHTMLRIMYGLADHVVAISTNQGEWMLRNQLVKPHKLTVIQAAKDLGAFLTIPEPHLRWPLVLGAYGRLSPEKGFDILLEALRSLEDLSLEVLLGGEGPEQERLAEMAQGLENVKFRGLVCDVPGFLKQCDLVVLPSRRETWGFVCMEAKAAARPVVASKVGGLSEQIVGCGLLTAPDNPRDLAESIRRLCTQDRATLQAFGHQGRQSVQGAWEHYLEQWEALMYGLIGGKRPHRMLPKQM